MKWKNRTVSAGRRATNPDRNTVRAVRVFAAALFTGIAVLDRFYQIGPLFTGRRIGPEVWEPNPDRFFHETPAASPAPSIRVLSLNTAHGRKEGSHRMLQSREAIRSNLDDIAGLLRRVDPDIVALQETDGPSAWSGMFDHVRHLSRHAGFPHSVFGGHVKGKRNIYGTALLSSFPLEDPLSIRFSPAPPTFAKGAVISTIHLPDAENTPVDVVSLHLDFARRSVRIRQVEEFIEKVRNRRRPLIVMGDFNCEWNTGEATLPLLARSLDLKTFKPEAMNMATYPTSERRLDWILLSKDLVFRNYHTIYEPLSDHLAVMADIAPAPRNGAM